MANNINNSPDNKGLGDAILKTSGLNPNAIEQNIRISSSWRAPKTGFFATFFPSEETWHPLYKNTNYEIMRNITGQMSDPTSEIDFKLYKNVEDVVKEAPLVKYFASASKLIFAIVIILILILILYMKKTSKIYMYILLGIVGILTIKASYNLVNYFVYAEGEGDNTWTTFATIVNSKIAAGKTNAKILEDFDIEEKGDKDRAVQASAMSSSNSSGFWPSLIVGLLAGGRRR